MAKNRISLTLDSDVLKRLDMHVKNSGDTNRSAAVEALLRQSLVPKALAKALILCGGKGTRLRPITYEIPKALIPIRGKPVVEHQLDLLKKFGITDVVLSVGNLKERIKEHFGNGGNFGVKIRYVEEEKPLGTAGPLSLARDMLRQTFIVCNGDLLYDFDVEAMFRVHRQNGALATIALTTCDDPSQYGVARLDGSRILEFEEKPKNPPSNLISSGFYIMEPEMLEFISRGHSMLERDVFPKVAKKQKLFGFPFSGQWFDLGTMERYEKAIREWKGIK